MRAWQPGDIILFAWSDRIGRLISTLQASWGDEDSQWTHAAMYVGEGRIVEAAGHPRWRVQVQGMDAFDRRMVRLHDPRLSDTERAALVELAIDTDAEYDLKRAFGTGFDAFFTGPHGDQANARAREDRRVRLTVKEGERRKIVGRCICSDFLDVVYQVATRYTLAKYVRKYAPPAAIYANEELHRHPVTFCRIPDRFVAPAQP